MEDGSLQFSFETADVAEPPNWLKQVLDAVEAVLWALAPLVRLVFWLGLAVIVGGLIYLLGRELLRRFSKATTDADAKEAALAPPKPAFAKALLAQADALAGQGLFDEALHILLFRSIEDIERRRRGVLSDAMTAREISALSVLPATARVAFAHIAAAVERSRFAGVASSAGVFHSCREAYLTFSKPENWA
ncbi:MAG: DUF4129 domain-containing protein [Pseudomonadota bacterium]